MEPSLRLIASRKILPGTEVLAAAFGFTKPSSEVEMKIVLSQMIGVEAPQEGSFVRQTTFSVSLHVTGRSCAAGAAPVKFGPRHCGQLPSSGPPKRWATATASHTARPQDIARIIR